MGRGPRSSCLAARLGLLAALLLGGPAVRGQGPSLGGPVGGGAGEADSRGSAVTSGVSGEESSRSEQPGGLTGGRNRRGGTPGAPTWGQLRGSPGDPDQSRLGAPLGASGTAGFDNAPGRQGSVLGGRFGIAGNRAPIGSFQPPGGQARDGQRRRLERSRSDVAPPDVDPISLSSRPRLDVPAAPEEPGPPDGLSLDDAIGLLIGQNLNLMALRLEVPKAEADVLTAGLRNNPILYADGQLVPYGNLTFDRPGGGGGQPQYDVNITHPLDVSFKRRARVEVARKARQVTEAQLQDAVRDLIDQLYTAFVNVLAARETLRYTDAYLHGISRILEQAEAQARRAQAEAAEAEDREKAEERVQTAREAVDDLRDQVEQGRFQARRAGLVLARTRRQLALLLNLPEAQAESLRVRGRLRELAALPARPEDLVGQALEGRPDLVAYRLGLQRAKADVRLARANRLSDVYVVYQPYTFQDNHLFGLKSNYAWALGVNAALPVYNRNQGNIARAEVNSRQVEIELADMERRVAHEVGEAIRAFQFSHGEVLELERDVLPASTRARDIAFEQYRKDPSKVNEYIDKQKDYNEVVQQYRNALIEHREDMLRLNTAVGARILP